MNLHHQMRENNKSFGVMSFVIHVARWPFFTFHRKSPDVFLMMWDVDGSPATGQKFLKCDVNVISYLQFNKMKHTFQSEM